MVYYRTRIQIKITQESGDIEQGPGWVQKWSPSCPLPMELWVVNSPWCKCVTSCTGYWVFGLQSFHGAVTYCLHGGFLEAELIARGPNPHHKVTSLDCLVARGPRQTDCSLGKVNSSLLTFPLYGWRNWNTEKLRNLPKHSSLVSERAGIQVQPLGSLNITPCWLKARCSLALPDGCSWVGPRFELGWIWFESSQSFHIPLAIPCTHVKSPLTAHLEGPCFFMREVANNPHWALGQVHGAMLSTRGSLRRQVLLCSVLEASYDY